MWKKLVAVAWTFLLCAIYTLSTMHVISYLWGVAHWSTTGFAIVVLWIGNVWCVNQLVSGPWRWARRKH